jgi:hypothetical protein
VKKLHKRQMVVLLSRCNSVLRGCKQTLWHLRGGRPGAFIEVSAAERGWGVGGHGGGQPVRRPLQGGGSGGAFGDSGF